MIKPKPSCMVRRARAWINRDHLKIGLRAKRQQHVVRAHQGMLPARRHFHPKHRLDIRRTFFKGSTHDSKVIKC